MKPACPYCSEVCSLAGPDGILWHILSEHPTSELAAQIKVEVAFYEMGAMA